MMKRFEIGTGVSGSGRTIFLLSLLRSDGGYEHTERFSSLAELWAWVGCTVGALVVNESEYR